MFSQTKTLNVPNEELKVCIVKGFRKCNLTACKGKRNDCNTNQAWVCFI